MPIEKQHRLYPPLLQAARELRQPQTPAEQKLWSRLRDRQLDGLKFRRQHPIARFIIDFYCAEARLCIEIDGDSHAEQVEYDQARTAYLNELGYTVMRFTNREVFGQLEVVAQAIADECRRLIADNDSPSPTR
jgi:very-short-patch-repair endonuclease